MSQIIKVKHSLTGDIRRVSSPSWDLSSLHNILVELFGADLPTPYSLSYTDSDGDVVSITSHNELREALQSVGRSGVLNLSVGPAGARPSLSFATPTRPLGAPFGISSFFSPTNTSSSSSSPYSSPYSYSTSSSSSSSPHSVRTLPLDASVTASQAHDTLFIDEYAPPTFVADFRRLLELGYGWEQTRDILIDFGGDLTKATQALRSSPRRMSVATSRPYFSVSFARMARDLQGAGFSLKDAVASLIRNGGVITNAALELASYNTEERCPNNHVLEVSSYNVGQYETSWYCNRCSQRNRVGQRWFCQKCSYDVCFNCKPAPPPAVLPTPTSSGAAPSSAPIISDMSLPPALLEPVRMLEAMGFTDRMRVIEALVSNSGDLVKCATLLAEERRKEEEKEAQIRRQQERIRRQQEQRLAREEAARRAAEQRAQAERRRKEEQLQRELESKRSDAAKIVVATPEKIGADLAYLVELGFDTVSSTTSLFNAGGDVSIALEELLRLQKQ